MGNALLPLCGAGHSPPTRWYATTGTHLPGSRPSTGSRPWTETGHARPRRRPRKAHALDEMSPSTRPCCSMAISPACHQCGRRITVTAPCPDFARPHLVPDSARVRLGEVETGHRVGRLSRGKRGACDDRSEPEIRDGSSSGNLDRDGPAGAAGDRTPGGSGDRPAGSHRHRRSRQTQRTNLLRRRPAHRRHLLVARSTRGRPLSSSTRPPAASPPV